jgi:hypothetical protein
MERAFIRSSYSKSVGEGANCLEASAPDGYTFRRVVAYCGNAACVPLITDEVVFGKSTRTAETSHCVEVAGAADALLVRDSKQQEGPTLTFQPHSFEAFASSVDSFVRPAEL